MPRWKSDIFRGHHALGLFVVANWKKEIVLFPNRDAFRDVTASVLPLSSVQPRTKTLGKSCEENELLRVFSVTGKAPHRRFESFKSNFELS